MCGGELSTWPHPLKARPSRDQKLATQSRVSGFNSWGGGDLFSCPYPLKVQARTTRDQNLATQSRVSGFNSWGGVDLFSCPYPLKVQARPPRDQRLATQSRFSGRNSRHRKGFFFYRKQRRSKVQNLTNDELTLG